jgi:hypothetical protein
MPIVDAGEWETPESPTGKRKRKQTSLGEEALRARAFFLSHYCKVLDSDMNPLKQRGSLLKKLQPNPRELDLWILPDLHVENVIVKMGVGASETAFLAPRFVQTAERSKGRLSLSEEESNFMGLPKVLLQAHTLSPSTSNTFKGITKVKGKKS